MGNPFVHAELHSNDLDGAKKFYEELFEWGLQAVPSNDSEYTMIEVGEGTGGGMMGNPAPGTSSHWLVYVGVDDAAATASRAEGLGATLVQPPTEVPGFGIVSVIADPSGATIGLWQAVAAR